jgi:DNA polymerase-1
MARALGLLEPLLKDPGVLKVGHNLKYDMLVLDRTGVGLEPVDDTMVLSYVLDGAQHGHGLDELSELLLGHTTIKFADVAGSGKNQVTFDRVALEAARDYAAEDADVTGRLHRLLKPRLARERVVTVYETLERPLIPVLVAMEEAGVLVDREELKALSRDFAGRLGALEEEIHRLAGHPFTIGSPKQLGEVLFEEMGLAGGRKGKSGAYATGAGVLEQLAAEGHELPERVLDWRQIAKLKSTYADALVEQINPETGRVHTSFSMAATSTGRLASSDPNLQNIPVRTEEGRKIRRAFVAAAGHSLLSVDYSQIELRLLAHVAGIEALREAFREGADIHALTAAQVFGVPAEGMDPLIRRKAKAINFGIIYGISPFGLAQQLGIPRGEAAAYIEAYFERYPGIRDYMEETKEFCRKNGYVATIFGRKCFVPGINDKNPARRSFAERAAINAPLQGAAADIIKRAMVRVPAALAGHGLNAKMLLQVHDELLFEVPEEELDETAKVATEVMEGAPLPALELSVPVVAEVGVGANWADAH